MTDLKDRKMKEEKSGKSEIVLYQTDDGTTHLDVRFEGETVWLTQGQMAELFQTSVPNISMHIRNLFQEKELSPGATVKEYLTVQSEGMRHVKRSLEHYNLDVIISVGYRVKSHRGTQFRIWATQRLREYIVKGFALDDERLKQRAGGNYVDYDPSLEMSQKFFAVVQNKMHWAAHGHTAAEIIARRADASKPHMGLTSWTGSCPRKTDVSVAKNYLNADELAGCA